MCWGQGDPASVHEAYKTRWRPAVYCLALWQPPKDDSDGNPTCCSSGRRGVGLGCLGERVTENGQDPDIRVDLVVRFVVVDVGGATHVLAVVVLWRSRHGHMGNTLCPDKLFSRNRRNSKLDMIDHI